MLRPDYSILYKIPDDIIYPKDAELKLDTTYSNLNSRDYQKRLVNRTPKILPFFEAIDINKKGQPVLGCNGFSSREWVGNVWGFERLEDFGKENKVLFKLPRDASITNLKFMRHNILILALANGRLELWSTHTETDNANQYCPFMIGNKSIHTTNITALDFLNDNKMKIVTGDSNGTLNIWDTGAADLDLIQSYHYTYPTGVNSISQCCNDSNLFVCCSDEAAVIWDYRIENPIVSVVYQDKNNLCKAVKCKENIVYIGDDLGNIIVIDQRKPVNVLNKVVVSDEGIRNISLNPSSKTMAVLGRSVTIKAYDSHTLEEVYQSPSLEDLPRDITWTTENNFYTVGWESKLKSHKIK